MTSSSRPSSWTRDDGGGDDDGASKKGKQNDEYYMGLALEEARMATSERKMPFGAVLVDDVTGEVLARAHNQCPAVGKRGGSSQLSDVTRHAEVELIRDFTTRIPADRRANCTMYASTEPCVMCAGATFWCGVGRLVYGCRAKMLEEKLSGPGGFDVDVRQLYGMASTEAARTKVQVVGPCLEEEALRVHDDAGIWPMSLKEDGKANKEEKDEGDNANSNGNKKRKASGTGTAYLEDIEIERSLKTSGLGSARVSDDGGDGGAGIVPVIDLSVGTDEEIAKQLWDAATRVGFFTVVEHGIDPSIIDGAFAASREFFSQPVEAKRRQSPFDAAQNSGYEHFEQVRPSTGLTDQKESVQITARSGCMDGRWPSSPPDFRDKADALLNASHKLARRLLDLLEPLATPQIRVRGTLANSHTLWKHDGQCTRRFLHYPPMPSNEHTAKLLEEGHWRAGPHTGAFSSFFRKTIAERGRVRPSMEVSTIYLS